jgi:dipeptidyl aminopeptidase/acylaminoacyl peptidase
MFTISHRIPRYMVWCALMLLALLPSPAKSGDVPLIPRTILFGNPEKAQPKLSPDGAYLAYCAPDKGVLNVYVRTIGKDDDRVVTVDRKRGVRDFFWQYDNAHVLYLQDQDGDENFHIFQADIVTKQTRDLTPFAGVRAEPLALSPRMPEVLLAEMNLRDRRYMDVYRINLRNGALEPDTTNPGDVHGWEADHTMQVRVAQASLADGSTEIRTRKDSSSPWRLLEKWGPDESGSGVVGFTPDNGSVYVISSVGANAARLLTIDLESGKKTVIAEDGSYDVNDILIHPEKYTLEAVQFYRARAEWKVLDPSLKGDFEALGRVCDGDFRIMSSTLAFDRWTVRYVIDDAPVKYYEYDRKSKKASFLFSSKPSLEKYGLAKMIPISFKARDGMEIHGYLTLPPGSSGKKLPLVLNVHGGPWGRDHWGFNSEDQWLANRGYAVLQVNFRGSTGYGKAFLNAGNREWGKKMHYDLLDAKKWAIEKGYADPHRVCIYGGSYGGYATLAALAFTPDEFQCGIDIVGPSNLITLIKSIPPYWATMRSTFDRRVGKLETEEEFLKSISPLFKANEIKVPLLIAQGANDPRVKQAESDQIVEAMRKRNKDVEYLLFPDEGHGFARPENNMIFYAAAESFLARYLGGRAEAPGDKEKAGAIRK